MQIFRHDLERTEGDRMLNEEIDRFLRQRLGKRVLWPSSWKGKESVRNGLISQLDKSQFVFHNKDMVR
jgi:hypothetical protein